MAVFEKMTMLEAYERGRVDHAKIDATTEDDIRRHMCEDGFSPDKPFDGLREVVSAASIRAKAGVTQAEMARRLHVPLETWLNWEQGRTLIEPAVRSFLALVADDPERAFRVLEQSSHLTA